ncbi:DUF4251 domain-containing protein [uncultured Nonlabens sp.]|uniref:DUF4251 domain-containing protein n=1 Tax=uncultured Nonlabens sp. TaxID=859306 RepID=UPI00261C374D|nr:DUF4251 domain-containing protein [uncultured Nonlabens sp.]
MKNTKSVVFIVLIMLLSSCKSSFTEVDRLQLIQLKEQISNQEIHFKATAAFPLNTQSVNHVINDFLMRNGNSAGRINLSGDNYTVQLVEDRAVFNLPFYGERRAGGGYNSDNSYNFTGKIKNSKIFIVEDSNYITYKFDVRNDTESINVVFKIFSIESAHLIINSLHRSSIKYDGHLINEIVK